MAGEALSQIKEAEAQAQQLIQNAQEEAARIIRCAEEEAAAARARASQACEQQALEYKRQAEAKTRAAGAAYEEETLRQCAALRQVLSPKKPAAVDAVMRSIAA